MADSACEPSPADTPGCVCAEINIRHCPVHGQYVPVPPAETIPENLDAPCNICGRGWPYHHDSCAYKQTAIERAALLAVGERDRRQIAQLTEAGNALIRATGTGSLYAAQVAWERAVLAGEEDAANG